MTKEQIVLGCCIENTKLFLKLLKYPIEIFIDEKNKLIYKTMLIQYQNKKTFDIITLTEILRGKIDIEYLTSLIDCLIYESNIDFYLEDLDNSRKLKEILNLGKKLEKKEITWQEIQNEYKKIIQSDIKITESIHTLQEGLVNYLEKKDYEYIESDFKWIRENIGGWVKHGRMIVVGARPGIGKTTFFANLNLSFIKKDLNVGFFSAEMEEHDYLSIIISCDTGINSNKIRHRNSMSILEEERLNSKLELLYKKNMVIVDTENIDINDLEYRLEIMINKYKINILGIDYLQLLNCNIYKKFPYREQINYISKQIKSFSRKYNIPIFVLAQLGRDAQDRRPKLSDLKESGQIEQDADMVILLHDLGKDEFENNEYIRKYEIIIDKNRFGAKGNFYLKYQQDICRFKDY